MVFVVLKDFRGIQEVLILGLILKKVEDFRRRNWKDSLWLEENWLKMNQEKMNQSGFAKNRLSEQLWFFSHAVGRLVAM